MNVLLTCAGRRVELVEFFRDALAGSGRVVAADSDADAPALTAADRAAVTVRVLDSGYVDQLVDLCREESVGLVVPSLETELPLLSRARARFAAVGTTVVVPDPEVTELCFDKVAADQLLEKCGLLVPGSHLGLEAALAAIDAGDLGFPVIVKPRWGTTSLGLQRAEDRDELVRAFSLSTAGLAASDLAGSTSDADGCGVLVQPEIAGEEYGLDIVNDLEGRYVATFAKRKLRMRFGQTDRAVTVEHPELLRVGEVIGRAIGHPGLLDCDVMVVDETVYVLDLNPRIGGGYPFSHRAGANYPAALVAWARGEAVDADWFKVTPGLTVTTSDLHVVHGAAPGS
jgi:carbamoyl-phosphate synthase large subunit